MLVSQLVGLIGVMHGKRSESLRRFELGENVIQKAEACFTVRIFVWGPFVTPFVVRRVILTIGS